MVPFAIRLSSAHSDDNLMMVAMHNARSMACWCQHIASYINFSFKSVSAVGNQDIVIRSTGRHRILAVILSSECSRVDFFVFDAIGHHQPPVVASASPNCPTPELHQLILWPSVPEENVEQSLRLIQALSSITSYPDAHYSIQWRRTYRVHTIHSLDEAWYQRFYDDTYYGIYFQSPVKVDMVDVKGRYGPFHLVLVQDLCPQYAFDIDRQLVVDVNLLALKTLLRSHVPRWYQVHATLDRAEAERNFDLFFGVSSENAQSLLPSGKGPAYPQINYAVLVPDRWPQIFVAIDPMDMLSLVIQSEWYHFEADAPALQVELGRHIQSPDTKSSMENLHRAALLGVSRIALIAHLPTDTQWYETRAIAFGRLVQHLHVLNENGWHQELGDRCLSIHSAASRIHQLKTPSAPDIHVARIQTLATVVKTLNQTIVAVGSSWDGPFTVWDGNHRAIALSLAILRGDIDLHNVTVHLVVGISSAFNRPHPGSFICLPSLMV